jgi:hypothetical protein
MRNTRDFITAHLRIVRYLTEGNVYNMLNPEKQYFNVTARQVIDAYHHPADTFQAGLEHFTERNEHDSRISGVYTVTYDQAIDAYEQNVIGMASISVSGIEEALRSCHESNVYG